MGLTEKLKGMKDTIVENFKEYEIIKDMDAKEIANRYGYEKLLTHIMRNIFLSKAEENSAIDEKTLEEVEINEGNPSFLIHIKRNTDDSVMICEEGFGEKERYDLNIIKTLIKKSGGEATLGMIEGTNDEYIRVEILPPKPSMEERLEEFYDARSEYIDYVKEKAGEAKKAAGSFAKKALNMAADWANKNL